MNISRHEVSVVICAYTEARWDDLVAAVRSLGQQSAPPLEIIVVIDHNPQLFARVQTGFGNVVATENLYSRGLSGARNTGVAAAKGSVVAFLDDDAVAAPDWLERLTAAYSTPRVVGVGGAIQPLWVVRRPRWFPEEFAWVIGCTYRGMPRTTAAVRNMIGANMSLRRDVLESIGGFRSGIGRVGTLPVGCEETELCIRVRQQAPSSVILYEPRASVQHRVPVNRATWRYFCFRCYSEGVSKALVAKFVGGRDALASERAYTFQTLPLGIVHGLRDAMRGDIGGLGRTASIVAGLAITTMGYLAGTVSQQLEHGKESQTRARFRGDLEP